MSIRSTSLHQWNILVVITPFKESRGNLATLVFFCTWSCARVFCVCSAFKFYETVKQILFYLNKEYFKSWLNMMFCNRKESFLVHSSLTIKSKNLLLKIYSLAYIENDIKNVVFIALDCLSMWMGDIKHLFPDGWRVCWLLTIQWSY